MRLRELAPKARYREARTGAVHQAAVLTEYGMHLELPPGDWSNAAVHLIRETEARGTHTRLTGPKAVRVRPRAHRERIGMDLPMILR